MTGIRDFEQAQRLEHGLLRVRWFAVILGAYLVAQTNTGPSPHATHTVLGLAYGIIAVLALGNLVIWLVLRRARSTRALQRLGLVSFVFDTVIIFALAWVYSYDPKGFTWVVIYILPLEGALRYQLEGALVSVALALVSEAGREVYLAARFPNYLFLVANVAFRVGIEAIIALVAGFMARSLAHEAMVAADEARRSELAAKREASARRELAAFNSAILAGVGAEDLDTSIRLMVGAIGRDLGFETFTILLREDDCLVVKGMFGMPFYADRIPIGSGVTGTVAATGRALAVPDVNAFPGYIRVDAAIRSEMAAPMRIGDEVLGVLDVESTAPDAFDQAALDVLARLADQIALVVHSNQLLSQQAETVNRLQELDQMKSEFVAITSHELRTPITAIRGFVKTLLRTHDRLTAEQISNFMQIIDRQSARLARLVEDLLFVSRIEAGTIRLSIERVGVQAFLRQVVEDLGLNARTRVWVEVDPSLDTIAIDPQRVEQVLRNLVENALKFSSQDAPVMIEARPRPNAVELAVVDRGAGIPPQDLPHIFERFHQAGEVLSREAEGAGLGLYITKRLVEAMGGIIDVSSVPGEGSTFRITLPLAGEAEAPDQGDGGPGTREPAPTEQAPTEAAPTAAGGT